MAKLADAADLKSAGAKALWGFDSPSRHQVRRSKSLAKNARDFACGLPSAERRGLTPAKRLNLKSAGAKALWGFDSPSRHQVRRSRSLAKNARDFACGLPSAERRGLTPAKRLNLKSAGAKALWGFDSPSRHQVRRSRSLAKNARDFACGLPSAERRGLTPAKRLNLKSAGAKALWGFDSPSRHQVRRSKSLAKNARDFACGLPSAKDADSRPQSGSTFDLRLLLR